MSRLVNLEHQDSLEFVIFRRTLVLSVILASLLLLLHIFYFGNDLSTGLDIACIMVFTILWKRSDRRKNLPVLILIYTVFSLIVLNLAWLYNGGFNQPTLYLLMLFFMVSMIMIPRKWRPVFIVLFGANMILLMALELNSPEFRVYFEDVQKGIISSDIFLILLCVLGTYLIMFIKDKYSDGKERIISQQNEMDQQAKELRELNEELLSFKEELEQRVMKHTNEIRIKNEKLIEYAFMNSHRVRTPLVRILGLTELAGKSALSEDELKYVREKVISSIDEFSHELDHVNEKLQQEWN